MHECKPVEMLVFKHGIGITGWTLNKIIQIHTSYHNKKNSVDQNKTKKNIKTYNKE